MLVSNYLIYILLVLLPLFIYINSKKQYNKYNIPQIKKPTNKKNINNYTLRIPKVISDKNKVYPYSRYVYSTNSTFNNGKVHKNMINETNYRLLNEPVYNQGLAWTDYNISKYPDDYLLNNTNNITNNIYKLDINKEQYKKKQIKNISHYTNNDGNIYQSLNYYNDIPMRKSNNNVKNPNGMSYRPNKYGSNTIKQVSGYFY